MFCAAPMENAKGVTHPPLSILRMDNHILKLTTSDVLPIEGQITQRG